MPSTKADKARKQERRDRQQSKDAAEVRGPKAGTKAGTKRAKTGKGATSAMDAKGAAGAEGAEESKQVEVPVRERPGERFGDLSGEPFGGTVRRKEAQPAFRRPLFLPRGSLRRRGWTDSGIVRFLGEPDAHAPNPVVPSAARMRLYDEERVAAVEATETWREWRTASEHRREAARIRAEERAQERAERIARTGVYAELASHVANR
ncbi:hypothetical protein OG216_07430 [Streptomycetaceae bacterium NBC_01309]